MHHPLQPPPPPFSKRPRPSVGQADDLAGDAIDERRFSIHGQVCGRGNRPAVAPSVAPATPTASSCGVQRRLFFQQGPGDSPRCRDAAATEAVAAATAASAGEAPCLPRRRTTDGRVPGCLAESVSLPTQRTSAGPGAGTDADVSSVSFSSSYPCDPHRGGGGGGGGGGAGSSCLQPHHEALQRRLSMPGEASGPSFSFPSLVTTSCTISGAPATPHRAHRLALSTSATMSGEDGTCSVAAAAAAAATAAASATAATRHLQAHHHPTQQHIRQHLLLHLQHQQQQQQQQQQPFSPSSLLSSRHWPSRATTPPHSPLHSGYPTPRSSFNGSSVTGSHSDLGFPATDTSSSRQLGRMLSGEERGLDTPAWVAQLRQAGRLLLSVLFAHLLLLEMREWRAARGYGWREWYDLSWAAEEMPPLPTHMGFAALALLLSGLSTSLAAAYLATRLLLQSVEMREEIIAVLCGETSNLLPVKELAVVGTVIVFVGHTYFVPDWLRAGGRGSTRRAKGRATGLMYTQKWRPGQSLIMLVGQLLLAPLFASICALQYYGLHSGAGAGAVGWRQRLLHPYYWLPSGDSSDNNWLPAQALAYLLLLTGVSKKWVPSALAALLVAEALTCWRFWTSSAWTSRHYVWCLRRHFTANLAIAGGLLLNLPEGKQDARALQKEASLGKKRA